MVYNYFYRTCNKCVGIYNGHMQGQEKQSNSIKDNTAMGTSLSLKDNTLKISYTKTNKLVTALYMVTDMIDKAEPLRTKLRSLGAEIVSDMQSLWLTGEISKGHKLVSDIAEILSFLSIANTLGIISPMNFSILRKEFNDLQSGVKESFENRKFFAGEQSLTDFFRNVVVGEDQVEDTPALNKKYIVTEPYFSKGHSIGHINRTRIGVQKGSTLMSALNKIGGPDNSMSIKNKENFKNKFIDKKSNTFLKGQRRDEIISIIKDNKNGVTISDIILKLKDRPNSVLQGVGDKTLQRELISMTEEKVLERTGTKRWSRYFVA